MTDVSTARVPANPGKRARDPYLDNAKFALVTLVVVGHVIINIRGVGAGVVWLWIYAFHMPAFIMISGYLSRNYRGTPRQTMGLLTSILTPYVVVMVILAVERRLDGSDFTLNFAQPAFALWYLVALFVWRLLTPLLRVMPYSVPAAVVVSLASLTFGGVGSDMSAARIVGFLPFFALGLWTTPQRLDALRRVTQPWLVRIGAAVVLLGLLYVMYLVRSHVNPGYLTMKDSTRSYHHSDLENMGIRLLVLVTATVMTVAFLALVPRRRSFLTILGENSMYIYLLQAIILARLLGRIGNHDWTTATLIALVACSIVMSALLGTPLVKRLTSWFIDPFTTFPWLRRLADRRVERVEQRLGT